MKKNITILIADDESTVREGLVEYLSLSYQTILEASNGLEAFDIYKKNKIDILITDINMPIMDGLTLIENIREENRSLAIIVLSAHSDKEKLFRAIKLGLVEYIVKPISRHILKEVLDKISIDKKEDMGISLSKEFSFHIESKTLLRDSKRVELTKVQALLLEILVLNIGKAVSSDDIYYHIHPDDNLQYMNASVRNIIKDLRKIIPQEMIKSIYGVGYMLHCD